MHQKMKLDLLLPGFRDVFLQRCCCSICWNGKDERSRGLHCRLNNVCLGPHRNKDKRVECITKNENEVQGDHKPEGCGPLQWGQWLT